MSDIGRHDETEPTRAKQPGEDEGDEGGEPQAPPATDEAPAGDVSAAAEQFTREEGESPSG